MRDGVCRSPLVVIGGGRGVENTQKIHRRPLIKKHLREVGWMGQRWALELVTRVIFIDLTQTRPELTPDFTRLEEKDS